MKVWGAGRIGSLELEHRLIMGSMHLNLEGRDDQGAALAAFYTERARGGASLIVTGGLAVSRVGAGGRLYAMINEQASQPLIARSVSAVHAEGGKIAAQLFHAGRYAFESAFGLTPVAPSSVYSGFSRSTPRELTEDDIRQTLQDFADAATAAADLGFDAIEVMASEGYLVNQFLSPLTNQRDDRWGGDPVRRQAFALELLRMIKQACPLPVIFRISGADLMPGSSSPAEIADYAASLARGGVDAINVGVGWHEARVPTVQTLVPQGIWVPQAEAIKDAVRAAGVEVPVIASNRINHVDHAEQVLQSGKIDFVSMARPFLADPRIVAKSRAGRLDLVNTCIACNEACIDRSIGDAEVSCLVNPRAGRELTFPQQELEKGPEPVEGQEPEKGPEHQFKKGPEHQGEKGPELVEGSGSKGKVLDPSTSSGPLARSGPSTSSGPLGTSGLRFAVIGGGPAGLEAARSLATLGHRVTLYEAGDELGGQFRMARQVPGKRDFGETIRYYTATLDELEVDVRLGTAVTDPDQLAGYDGIVIATGVQPRRLDLPGVAAKHVLDYQQAFADPDTVGRRVAIIGGGGIAVDLAHLLLDGKAGDDLARRAAAFRAEWGVDGPPTETAADREVTLMRRSGKIGAGMGITTRWAVVGAIRHHGARMITGIGYRAITEDGVMIDTEDGEHLVEAETVIIAAGQQPNNELIKLIDPLDIPYEVIGGAADTAELNAVLATSQGLEAAYDLDRRLSDSR